MKKLLTISLMLCLWIAAGAQNVTVHAVDEPAADVFRSIVEQTGMNFVYSSELLKDMRVSVDVSDKPLGHALTEMFRDSDIQWKIKNRNIILKKKRKARAQNISQMPPLTAVPQYSVEAPNFLDEILVLSRLEAPAVETSEIGAKKLTASEIIDTPVLFGESDVLKALQLQPGVSGGAEAMAGMHVHGGNADENLFMLDNVPLYQVNHFGGLFSAFNVDAIRYIDFFKSSIPAKYDGRLSSYLDVRTKDGSLEGHHGSAKLGLTSGAFNIDGPIGHKTSYSVALRRSWFDVFSIPVLAIVNKSSDEQTRFRYAFTDLNGKITHRFNSRTKGFVSVYYGEDYLETGTKDKIDAGDKWYEDEIAKMNWGNIVAQAGLNYRLRPLMTAEFTAAYTRYFSTMKYDYFQSEIINDGEVLTDTHSKTKNNINDWIARADFDWQPNESNRVRFGAGYTLHSFLPARVIRNYFNGTESVATRDSTTAYLANEVNLYIEDDWKLNDKIRLNAGFHGSMFNISGKTHFGIGPRLSVAYRPTKTWALKAAYSRTNQYVHQLCQTYLSLPTDQWVPITGDFKPQTSDKVAVGAYWQSDNRVYEASVEGYYKFMRNLVDYRDEYYLQPLMDMWSSRLCSGKGTAEGIDFKFEKVYGKFTGHIAYSLAWADRTFAEKNGGKTFPARFDHRHTIKILLNWNISNKVSLNAAWTGHSGNRYTLLPQVWESPRLGLTGINDPIPLQAGINNYQLPFYHRLDLSCTVKNKRGYWNFGLYNAYCHMNVLAVCRAYNDNGDPVLQKVKLLPVIPSISYTWLF